MPDPRGIKPRRLDERAYERAMRKAFLDPLFANMRGRLQQADTATDAYRAINAAVRYFELQPNGGVQKEAVIRALNRIQTYHRAKVLSTFRSALGVNVNPFMLDAGIPEYLRASIDDNVGLIKTIPQRMHTSLSARIVEEFTEAAFDQQRLTQLVRREYKSSGYNLRRIVRDQNSKLVGGLNRVRQEQLGVSEYRWLTSGDERVRPSHAAKSGQVFAWGNPPGDTGHPGNDVQCRCVARPIVTRGTANLLKTGSRLGEGQ